ncbi:MAG: flagellar basal body rod protein FlgB [Polaromonas sp.]|jgi:flagellar basal-body rod protein FlgB
MLNLTSQNLDFQTKALVLRSQRQQVLAANIANADTPGYVAKELNFTQALRQASGSGAGRSELLSSSDAKTPGHIRLDVRSSKESTSLYAKPSQASADNNSVDMDRERASFADNSLHYEATLRFINSHMRTMLSAIQGQ